MLKGRGWQRGKSSTTDKGFDQYHRGMGKKPGDRIRSLRMLPSPEESRAPCGESTTRRERTLNDLSVTKKRNKK